MPFLDWIGKDKVINHHNEVPFRVFERQYSYDENGQHSEDNSSKNMIIHGDNLEALKSLLPRYENKIKCIYIDPPYNTGNENWIYNDNVNDPKIQKWLGKVVGPESKDLTRHDKWLCMMYPRLKLLQKLLSDDGVIFISIDDNEQANLKLICDEIFGSNNFCSNIHWRRSESQNNGGKLLSTVGEYILCYLKNKTKDSYFNKIELTEKAKKEYRYSDEKGYFRRGTIVDSTRGKYELEVTAPSGNKKIIKSIRTPEFIQEQDKNGMIYWTKTGTPYLKIYLDKSEGQISNNWFDNAGVNEDARDILSEMKINFDFSKPFTLMEKLFRLSTDENSIILDSFAGSGTTAHAVLNMNKADGGNRKFILIEMEDYADDITAERVKRVINGYGDGKKKVGGTGGDFSFYTLGETILKDDVLNENLPIDTIREYIWFTETRSDFKQPDSSNKYFLGDFQGTDYYFYYEKDSITTLNYDFCAKIDRKNSDYIIYADVCTMSEEELMKYNITFKKIPRDITRF